MNNGPEFSGKAPVPLDELQALIANTEKKCLLQLLAQPEEELCAHDFYDRFAEAQDPVGAVTYKSMNTLQRNIVDSHSRAGTFETYQDSYLATWRAEKAPDSTIADSLAGHNLGLTADYGLSLEEFWGKTSKTQAESLRSPQIRLRIFEVLADTKPGQTISIPKLASSLGLPPGIVHKHIQRLYSFGFIEYQATELNNQTPTFVIVGNPDPAQSTLTREGQRQRNILNNTGSPAGHTQLGQRLMAFQQAGRITFTRDDLVGGEDPNSDTELRLGFDNMKLVLRVMVREGTLRRVHKTVADGDQFSDIFLDEPQKEIIDRAVRFHRGLRDNDPAMIKEGLERGVAIMQDRRLVAGLLKRGYDHSPYTKMQSYEERAARIGQLLVGNTLSTREIQQQLTENPMTLSSVAGLLRQMRLSGRVISQKVGNQQLWQVVADTPRHG